MEIALTVIKNTHDFEKALSEWHNKAKVDKTWANFKDHFKKAQMELKEIRGPAMLQPGQHHANLLVSQIRDDMHTRNAEVMQLIQTVLTENENENEENEESEGNNVNSVNATVKDNVQVEMLRILRNIATNINNNNNNNSQNGQGGGARRRPRKTPDNANFHRRVTNKYCWTHGGCAHNSTACTRKANGHQDNATFTNRMGGSNAFC